MKLFISADIEGTTGIAHWDETEKNHPDWKYFSDQMTKEVKAACEGAMAAGCADILVKDAHDSARNIDPRQLPECVRLLRGWTGAPASMMAGLDESFDGVVFTGYHSAAGWNTNPLSHTMNTKNCFVTINGEKASELMMNALTAAYYKVPVLCVTGDKGLCDYIKKVIPEVETVPVNEGWGNGVISIHPDLAIRRIHEAVQRAAEKTDKEKCLFPLPEHFEVEICYKQHQKAHASSYYPGVTQVNETTVHFACDDYMDVLKYFKFILSE